MKGTRYYYNSIIANDLFGQLSTIQFYSKVR